MIANDLLPDELVDPEPDLDSAGTRAFIRNNRDMDDLMERMTGSLFSENEPMPRIPGEFMTSTVAALLKAVSGMGDRSIMPIISDALQDAGCEDENLLDAFRDRSWGLYCLGFQETREGEQAVSVTRWGEIKIFIAQKRQKDGLLTWRLQTKQYDRHFWVAEARAYAQEHGMTYLVSCRHGDPCR